MEYEIKETGIYQVLTVMEKIDLYNISEFKKVLFEMTSGKHSHVAVDLKANFSDMSSSVVGALISGQKKMSIQKGSFVLINISSHVQNLFALAGLQDFFTTVEHPDQLV